MSAFAVKYFRKLSRFTVLILNKIIFSFFFLTKNLPWKLTFQHKEDVRSGRRRRFTRGTPNILRRNLICKTTTTTKGNRNVSRGVLNFRECYVCVKQPPRNVRGNTLCVRIVCDLHRFVRTPKTYNIIRSENAVYFWTANIYVSMRIDVRVANKIHGARDQDGRAISLRDPITRCIRRRTRSAYVRASRGTPCSEPDSTFTRFTGLTRVQVLKTKRAFTRTPAFAAQKRIARAS